MSARYSARETAHLMKQAFLAGAWATLKCPGFIHAGDFTLIEERDREIDRIIRQDGNEKRKRTKR